MTYIYPDNLASKATLWMWELKDVAILGVGLLLSAIAFVQFGLYPPLVLTAVYAFLTIRVESTSILDFIRYGVSFFFLKPQTYRWEEFS